MILERNWPLHFNAGGTALLSCKLSEYIVEGADKLPLHDVQRPGKGAVACECQPQRFLACVGDEVRIFVEFINYVFGG